MILWLYFYTVSIKNYPLQLRFGSIIAVLRAKKTIDNLVSFLYVINKKIKCIIVHIAYSTAVLANSVIFEYTTFWTTYCM